MVSLRFSALAALCVTLASFSVAVPAPAPKAQGSTKRATASTPGIGKMFENPAFAPPPKHEGRMFSGFVPPHNLTASANALEKRATLSPPYWVVYNDAWVSGEQGPPATSSIAGFNVFIMSFLLASGTADQATEWQSLTADQRSSIKSAYNAAGIKLLVSAFGSTETPTSSNFDATTTANNMAAWVIQYNLDGIDVDYEDFAAINRQDGSAEAWLETFTKQLRAKLPAGQYIITHAPVAPWFSAAKYASGAYAAVNSAVGSLIDWYNVQFYNQGTSEYTTCSGLLTASSSTWPNTAVFQIAASGVPLNKIVIGKPATTADANNGYIAPATLATCLQTAKAQGWSAGAMFWQFPNAGSSLISTVRSLSWPVSGTTPTSTPTSPTSTPTSTPTGGSGQCAGVSAWSSSVAYNGGQKVTYSSHLWTAKWWTEADTPGGAAGVWTDNGAC